jgi:RNA polymerase sigma factor (TIGR02999 family)
MTHPSPLCAALFQRMRAPTGGMLSVNSALGDATGAMDGDITELLKKSSNGDVEAGNALYGRIYAELHKLARARLAGERTMTNLDAPALVNEAYLRLARRQNLEWRDRRMFFAYAARVMRSVVIDYVRERQSLKRGGAIAEVTLATGDGEQDLNWQQLEAINNTLADLKRIDERLHQIVELRYFVGLSIEEVAELLELAPVTVKRKWQAARAFLYKSLSVVN